MPLASKIINAIPGAIGTLTGLAGSFVPFPHFRGWFIAGAAASFVFTISGVFATNREEGKAKLEQIARDEKLEAAITKALAEKLDPEEPPPAPEQLLLTAETPESASAKDEIEGKIYRAVIAPKAAFADQVRQVFKMMGRTDEFGLGVDVLVELYVVNASEKDIFIQDFVVTVEVDGKLMHLERQKDFQAFELNDIRYRWSLIVSPEGDKTPAFAQEREELSNLSDIINKRIAPHQPAAGWLRFVAPHIDPEKLSSNPTFKLYVVDSLGKQHLLGAAMEARSGTITAASMDRPLIPSRPVL